MSPRAFNKLVDGDVRALVEEGERMAQDPPPNAAERHAAAKHDAKHRPTPAPWQVHSDYQLCQVIGDCDVDNHYTAICDTDSDDANPASVDAANARHIVKCVNAHRELVKALRQMTTAPAGMSDDWYQTIARAALAKADRA